MVNFHKLKKYLNPNPKPKEPVDPYIKMMVEDHGKYFIPAKLPRNIKRGRIGDCFDTCMDNLIRDQGSFGYVEGIATTGGQDYYHSWITDSYGRYSYDPTWFAIDNKTGEETAPHTTTYKGLIFWPPDVFWFVRATTFKGVLINRNLNRLIFMQALARSLSITQHAKKNDGIEWRNI